MLQGEFGLILGLGFGLVADIQRRPIGIYLDPFNAIKRGDLRPQRLCGVHSRMGVPARRPGLERGLQQLPGSKSGAWREWTRDKYCWGLLSLERKQIKKRRFRNRRFFTRLIGLIPSSSFCLASYQAQTCQAESPQRQGGGFRYTRS